MNSTYNGSPVGNKVIVINPIIRPHEGEKGKKEFQVMDVAFLLKGLLSAAGAKVILTQEDIKAISVKEGVSLAREVYADIFVSLRTSSNNGDTSKDVNLFHSYRSFGINRRLVKSLHQAFTGVNVRSTPSFLWQWWMKEKFPLLNKTPKASDYVEWNEEIHSAMDLETKEAVRRIASGLCQGVIRYFKGKKRGQGDGEIQTSIEYEEDQENRVNFVAEANIKAEHENQQGNNPLIFTEKVLIKSDITREDSASTAQEPLSSEKKFETDEHSLSGMSSGNHDVNPVKEKKTEEGNLQGEDKQTHDYFRNYPYKKVEPTVGKRIEPAQSIGKAYHGDPLNPPGNSPRVPFPRQGLNPYPASVFPLVNNQLGDKSSPWIFMGNANPLPVLPQSSGVKSMPWPPSLQSPPPQENSNAVFLTEQELLLSKGVRMPFQSLQKAMQAVEKK